MDSQKKNRENSRVSQKTISGNPAIPRKNPGILRKNIGILRKKIAGNPGSNNLLGFPREKIPGAGGKKFGNFSGNPGSKPYLTSNLT